MVKGHKDPFLRAEDPAITIKLDQEIVNSGYLINDWLDLVSLT